MRAIASAVAAVLGFPCIALAQGGGGVLNTAPAPIIEARAPAHDVGNAATPVFDGPLMNFNNRTLPTQGNEAEVQSSNSLPRNAAPASSPLADRMQSARGETVAPGRLTPNNGSGISQTAASMPPGAMTGTLPQMNTDAVARHHAAHKDRQLAALQTRQMARAARQVALHQPATTH